MLIPNMEKKFLLLTFLIHSKSIELLKASSGIRTHELQIRCEASNLLRYAVRWQFGKGKLKNYT